MHAIKLLTGQCPCVRSYEAHRGLLKALAAPDPPVRHWTDDSGWEMARACCKVIEDDLKARVAASPYFTICIDESCANDMTQYLSIEIQFMEAGRKVTEFLVLEQITEGTAERLTKVVLDLLESKLGLSRADI